MLTKTPEDLLTKMPPLALAAREPAKVRPPRDPRLDFFRGLCMMIIMIAHVPFDDWALYIPARFGFSDAAEVFVFLSGMASAIAYGRLFDREGGFMVAARVVNRIWQVYWAHVGLFVVVTALMVYAGPRPGGGTYVEGLNLLPFIQNPGPLLVGLLTLTYVPNYFDILPMYLVVLALVPLMLYAERVHKALPFVLMVALWLPAQFDLIQLPAEPWSDRPWFFDPFAWQLLFFTGFFFMRRTLPVPPLSRGLLVAATVLLVAAVPFAWHVVLEASPWFRDAAKALLPFTDKSDFGILRFVHFLALCTVALALVGEKGSRLAAPAIRPLVRPLMTVGQQSLAVFIASMVLAQIIGIYFDYAGRTFWPLAIGNLAGFAVLIGIAYLVTWFKKMPWKVV